MTPSNPNHHQQTTNAITKAQTHCDIDKSDPGHKISATLIDTRGHGAHQLEPSRAEPRGLRPDMKPDEVVREA